MSLFQSLLLLGLTAFAIHRQTRPAEIAGQGRFGIAIGYAGIAVITLFASGWAAPRGAGWWFFLSGLALSAIVGVARGRMTRIWVADDGRRMRAGTVATVGWFVAMLAVKIGLGLYARLHGIGDGGGFGEILLVVAIMVAAQAEIVHRRATMRGFSPGHGQRPAAATAGD